MIPFIFEAGEVASAVEVNANFSYLADLLGADDVEGGIVLKNGARVGEARRGSINATTSTAAVFTWNAEEYKSGASRKFRRIDDNQTATALEVNDKGFEVKTTSAKTGDLNSQLKTVLAIRATSGEDYMYFADGWHMSRVNKVPAAPSDYRLTYTPLTEPITIFENKSFSGSGFTMENAWSLGVPKSAVMIKVLIHITAWNYSGSALYVQQARKNRHKKYGTIVHAYGGSAADFGRSGGEGDVLLGTDSYAGQFVVERTAGFETASLWIKGFYS